MQDISLGDSASSPSPGYHQGGVFGQLAGSVDDMLRAGSSSVGYRMSIEEMRAILPEWEDLCDDLKVIERDSQRLATTTPPAEDDGSTLQIRAAHEHAGIYSQTALAQSRIRE